MMTCKQCQDIGEVNAWASSGEYETEPCPACSVPAVYTVTTATLTSGQLCFEVWNTRTGRVAMSTPDRARADLEARYRNLYEPTTEADPDWVAGSNSNWWTRNAGEAA